MQVYGMDPELVEIYNIRNLESIKIWDLVTPSPSKMIVMPTILIVYDGGKVLNLCCKDKYYDVYVKKVMEVYQDEKNNIVEDALTDPFRLRSTILIDERSLSILESGELKRKNEVYGFYDGKDSYNQSLCFQRDEVRPFIPVLIYHLEKLFSLTDRVVSIDSELSGYRDNYILNGRVDGIDTIFPFTYEKVSSDEYVFHIAGMLGKSEPIKVKIEFANDGIIVTMTVDKNELVATSKMSVTNGVVKSVFDVERKGLTICYTNEDLEGIPLDNKNLADLDYDTKLEWFKLPWGALYGIDTSIDELSETEKMIGIDSMYIQISDNCFMKKEFYSKTYKRNKTVAVDANDMVLDQVDKTTIGFSVDPDDHVFVIETSFDDSTSNYKASGKNFYHAIESKSGIEGIKRENLVSLGRKEELIHKSDLVNKSKILMLVRGE